MDVIVHGADSETYYGRPMTLQFYSEHMNYSECLWVDEHTATTGFFEWADSLPRHCLNLVYVHNLEFDLPEFFWDFKEELITAGGDFDLELGNGWRVRGVYGKPTFARLTNRQQNRSIMIVDSMLWFQTSLAKTAEIVCPKLPKLKMPNGLGTKKFGMRDEHYYNYAMRDAVVAFHAGVVIQKLVREFDIMQPVSLADMSAKIFRHHFLKRAIPQCSNMLTKAAMESYHGGKNNVVEGMAPGWHLDVTGIDIKSAYPYGMSQLPSMSVKNNYKRMKLQRTQPKQVEPLGVYRVSGEAFDCDWPVIFQHNFTPIQGKFRDVHIQGMELNEALRSGEIRITKIRGHYYDTDRDGFESPFDSYCREFYRRKETERDPVLRYMYKIILNSVYGKFIQTHKQSRIIYTDCDSGETQETSELVAGGMFHPFIASAICAHTRVYIHQVEHEHKAIHTATDGVFTKYKRIRPVPMAPRTGLGSLEIEFRGDLVLLRNKCYIGYGDEPADPEKPFISQYFPGKFIHKAAKHGFQGTVYDLEKCVALNIRKYKTSRPNKLRESLKRGLDVNDFVERDYNLKVGPIPIIG